MAEVPYPRTSERRPRPTGSDGQKQVATAARIGPLTRSEMHELGNLIVALQFCLRQLGGRQRTDELEGVVRNGLEVCEQGITAFRKVHEAVRVRR